MKFYLSTFFFALLTLFSLASAAPVDISKRDVFVPPVLTPNHKTIWKIGTHQTVTWDVSKRPKQITNTKGKIILVNNGLLDLDNPLAEDFEIVKGEHRIEVPNVTPGDYQILVFGDSGNVGQHFKIIA